MGAELSWKVSPNINVFQYLPLDFNFEKDLCLNGRFTKSFKISKLQSRDENENEKFKKYYVVKSLVIPSDTKFPQGQLDEFLGKYIDVANYIALRI